MLTELCQELRNWFVSSKHYDTFEITGGTLTVPFLQDGQYFRIKGSVFNDGVWKYGDSNNLKAETFTGEIWAMAVPPDVISLSNEIDSWVEENASAINSPYTSESWRDYSRTLRDGGSSASGAAMPITWQNQFASKLRLYRKV